MRELGAEMSMPFSGRFTLAVPHYVDDAWNNVHAIFHQDLTITDRDRVPPPSLGDKTSYVGHKKNKNGQVSAKFGSPKKNPKYTNMYQPSSAVSAGKQYRKQEAQKREENRGKHQYIPGANLGNTKPSSVMSPLPSQRNPNDLVRGSLAA